jgi:LAO/AO transport system kinase
MKAGIMEIPAIAVVTKADMAAADRTAADLKAALSLVARSDWEVPVLSLSATSGAGTADLARAIDRHRQHLAEGVGHPAYRDGQAKAWVRGVLAAFVGERGLELVQAELDGAGATPFESARRLLARIEMRLRPSS